MTSVAAVSLSSAIVATCVSLASIVFAGRAWSNHYKLAPYVKERTERKRKTDVPDMSEDFLRSCVPRTDGTFVKYDFHRGKDGLLYMLNSDEPDPRGWLDTLSDVRKSIVPILGIVGVVRDGVVNDPDDERLTITEFERIKKILTDDTFSGINSASFRDVGSYAVTTCGGAGVFITSKDFYPPRNWRQQNVLYVLHEIAHVACGNPPQEKAHNLEFYRVLRILTKAAESLGKKVYDPDWYAWDIDTNVDKIGAWIGTRSWFEKAKRVLLGGFRWRNRTLERGEDWYPEDTGTLVWTR